MAQQISNTDENFPEMSKSGSPKKIEKTQNCLVLYGADKSLIESPNFLDTFRGQLNMSKEDSEKVSFREFRTIQRGQKSAPIILITLGQAFQRNLCLKYSKNLPKNMLLDKYVPKFLAQNTKT